MKCFHLEHPVEVQCRFLENVPGGEGDLLLHGVCSPAGLWGRFQKTRELSLGYSDDIKTRPSSWKPIAISLRAYVSAEKHLIFFSS